MKTIHVKPGRPDLIVRDPVTRAPLPAEGDEKPDSTYWRRRLRDGDVLEVKPAGKAKAEHA